MIIENGRSKFWFGIYCYYYWEWADTSHYYINTHAEEKQEKCGRQEVHNVVKESVEFEISSEVFTEIINYLIEKKSVIVNTFRNHISLPKGIFRKFNWKGRYQRTISSI